MMIVASLVPNFLMGIITGAGVLVSHNYLTHTLSTTYTCQVTFAFYRES